MKIMVAYDGTNAAKEALYLARKYAKALEASADIVTSMRSGKENQQEEIEGSVQGLEWAKATLEAEGVSCETHFLVRIIQIREAVLGGPVPLVPILPPFDDPLGNASQDGRRHLAVVSDGLEPFRGVAGAAGRRRCSRRCRRS